MRQTKEIEMNYWDEYLSALSYRERGQLIGVHILDNEAGEQVLTESMPLVGISCETKDDEAIAITVAHGEAALTHHIVKPQKMMVLLGNEGEPRALDIEDAQKIKTLIFFRT
jgi:hypothetical protein